MATFVLVHGAWDGSVVLGAGGASRARRGMTRDPPDARPVSPSEATPEPRDRPRDASSSVIRVSRTRSCPI